MTRLSSWLDDKVSSYLSLTILTTTSSWCQQQSFSRSMVIRSQYRRFSASFTQLLSRTTIISVCLLESIKGALQLTRRIKYFGAFPRWAGNFTVACCNFDRFFLEYNISKNRVLKKCICWITHEIFIRWMPSCCIIDSCCSYWVKDVPK